MKLSTSFFTHSSFYRGSCCLLCGSSWRWVQATKNLRVRLPGASEGVLNRNRPSPLVSSGRLPAFPPWPLDRWGTHGIYGVFWAPAAALDGKGTGQSALPVPAQITVSPSSHLSLGFSIPGRRCLDFCSTCHIGLGKALIFSLDRRLLWEITSLKCLPHWLLKFLSLQTNLKGAAFHSLGVNPNSSSSFPSFCITKCPRELRH